jgi:predicted lipoprotein with Yx(FWY)xxD motif
MQQMKKHSKIRPASAGRLAAAAMALGGLSAGAVALGTAGTAGASTKAVHKVTVTSMKVNKVGKVLASGKTLYTLKASSTACTAACMKFWPALTLPKGVSKASAGSGVSSSKLGTVTLASGLKQVTYGGKALYLFVGDSGPGMATGNVTDTWGKWSDVVLAKAKGSHTTSAPTPTTAGSGGSSF